MARWRVLLPGLLLGALVACGGATTTSNQTIADPTATVAARPSVAPSTAAVASAPAAPSAATSAAPSVAAPSVAAPSAAPTAAPSASAAPRPSAAAGTSAPAASRAPVSAAPASAAPTSTAPASRAPASTAPSAAGVPQPRGTIPAGWKVFRGPKEYPFVMAYPPDWTVDESYFPEQSIIFFVGPSGNTDEESVAVVWGARQTEANIDVLRDEFFFQRSEFCVEKGIEYTEYRQLSDATFAILGASCDQGGTLFFLQVGAGLKGGDEWDVFMRTSYERKEAMRRTIFDPMLASLNIYAPLP